MIVVSLSERQLKVNYISHLLLIQIKELFLLNSLRSSHLKQALLQMNS